MRSGFGLIQAIFFILAISFIGLVAIDYSKISVKATTDTYLKEQANIFMQSATEYGILAIVNRDRTVGCLNSIRVVSKNRRFVADISITDYMLRDTNATVQDATDCSGIGATVHPVLDTYDNRLNGSGIFYIQVESNSTHPKMIGNKIRLVKRVWQKF